MTTAVDRPAQTPPTPVRAPRRSSARDLLRRNILLVAMVLMIVAFQLMNGAFLSMGNVRGILLDLSLLLIVSVPAGLLLIAGYVDFSVGSTIGLTGVSGGLMLTAGVPVPVTVIAALLIAALVGVANGYLVTVLGFSPIIVTMGMLALVAGITLGIGGIPTSGYPDAYRNIGGSRIAGIPLPVILAVAVLAVAVFVVVKLPVGRHIYAIGANKEAAFLSAIKVRSVPFALYVATAAAAGLGGIITTSRLNTAAASLGSGFEITLLTALLLGGVSFVGGSGSLFGIVVGVLFLGVLQNGLVMIGAPNFLQQAATGAVLVAAAALNYLAERRR